MSAVVHVHGRGERLYLEEAMQGRSIREQSCVETVVNLSLVGEILGLVLGCR